jgi:hypothetical protein
MAYKKKTWKEKLADDKGYPKVEKLTGKMINKWGKGTIVIPAPKNVDDIMKKVMEGRLTTINEIRNFLAKKHKATICCPITTGIFSWISAHAAEEEKANGVKNITPYWRTLKSGGELNPKYPGGIENQKKLLEKEGHEVYQKGKRWLVYDFESKLMKL